MRNKILVISPHTDDVELSCGGSIIKWLSQGDDIYYIAFSDCQDTLKLAKLPLSTLEYECQKALKTIGLKKSNINICHFKNKFFMNMPRKIYDKLENIKNIFKPNFVIIPSLTETHQDHLTVAHQANTVFRRDTTVLSYEQPWNDINFKPNYFISLNIKQIQQKIQALNCYRSQLMFKRPYFDEKFIISWAKTRGIQINQKYAEAFNVIKIIR